MEFYIPIAALFSALGNLMMKLSSSNISNISNLYFLAGGGSYMLNLLFFKKALSLVPLSIGYPLLATLSIALSSIMAIIFLNETINAMNISGIILCIFGIILISQ